MASVRAGFGYSVQAGPTVKGADVLVLAVTESEERKALEFAFGIDHGTPPPWRVVLRGGSQLESLQVAVDVIGAQGGTTASSFTMNRLIDLTPRLAILTGTCGCRRHSGLFLNDVTIADLIVEYEPAEIRAEPAVASNGVLAPLKRLSRKPADHRLVRPKYFVPPWGLLRQTRGWIAGSNDAWAEPWRSAVGRLGLGYQVEPGARDHPTVHFGPIAGGEKKLANKSIEALAEQFHQKLRVVEMEGHGFAEACYQQGVPWLVVRGACDYAGGGDPDSLKGDGPRNTRAFHLSASLAATLVVREMLPHLDLSDGALLGSRVRTPRGSVGPLTTYSDQAGYLYRVGREIADQARTELIVIQRTPTLLFDPERIALIIGRRKAHFGEEVDFREVVARRAREATPGSGFSFLLLFFLADSQAELNDARKYPDGKLRQLRAHVMDQIDTWKGLESSSSRGAAPGEGFRIDAIQGRASGPMAASERKCCLLLGSAKNNETESVFSLSVNEFDLDRVREFKRDLGSAPMAPRLSAQELKEAILGHPA